MSILITCLRGNVMKLRGEIYINSTFVGAQLVPTVKAYLIIITARIQTSYFFYHTCLASYLFKT